MKVLSILLSFALSYFPLAANAAPGAPSAREYFRRNPTHRDDGSNPAPPNTDTLTETDSDKNVTKDKVLEDLLKKYTS